MKAEELAVRLNKYMYFVSLGGDPIQTHDRRVKIELEVDLVSEGIVKKYLKNMDTSKSVNSEDFPAWVSKL